MTPTEFTAEFQCECPVVDEMTYALAVECEAKCEAYDRFVCTGTDRNGTPVPATPRQSALINHNARDVMRDASDRLARSQGIEPTTAKQAILKALKQIRHRSSRSNNR